MKTNWNFITFYTNRVSLDGRDFRIPGKSGLFVGTYVLMFMIHFRILKNQSDSIPKMPIFDYKQKIKMKFSIQIQIIWYLISVHTKVSQSYLGLALEMALRVKNLSVIGFRYVV